MTAQDNPDREFRRHIHAGLAATSYRHPEMIGENFFYAVPWPGERPLSANQIFNRMARPRFRTMRHLEAALDEWVDEGEIEIHMVGHSTLYRWTP
jgi:hypothetical protein